MLARRPMLLRNKLEESCAFRPSLPSLLSPLKRPDCVSSILFVLSALWNTGSNTRSASRAMKSIMFTSWACSPLCISIWIAIEVSSRRLSRRLRIIGSIPPRNTFPQRVGSNPFSDVASGSIMALSCCRNICKSRSSVMGEGRNLPERFSQDSHVLRRPKPASEPLQRCSVETAERN